MKSRRARKRPTRAPEGPRYPRVFETFQAPTEWTIAERLMSDAPRVGNGDVQIRRYEITIRRIEEAPEVLLARLQRLWHESERNSHNWDAMYNAARDLGCAEPRKFLKYEEQGRDYNK